MMFEPRAGAQHQRVAGRDGRERVRQRAPRVIAAAVAGVGTIDGNPAGIGGHRRIGHRTRTRRAVAVAIADTAVVGAVAGRVAEPVAAAAGNAGEHGEQCEHVAADRNRTADRQA